MTDPAAVVVRLPHGLAAIYVLRQPPTPVPEGLEAWLEPDETVDPSPDGCPF